MKDTPLNQMGPPERLMQIRRNILSQAAILSTTGAGAIAATLRTNANGLKELADELEAQNAA